MEVLEHKVDDLTQMVRNLSHQLGQYMSRGPSDPGTVAKEKKDDDIYKQDFSQDENEERGNWSGRLDFLLACLGYAVGLGNVWRFPYLCYTNGGAVFFIPYVIMLLLVGMPIFFLELSLGQYTSNGPLTCWEMAKFFKGVGFGMTVVSGLVGIYYNMIIAWAIYYLFASFTSQLPWEFCGQEWNSPFCRSSAGDSGLIDMNMTDCAAANLTFMNDDGLCYNDSMPVSVYNVTAMNTAGFKTYLPSEEYLKYNVWQIERDAAGNDISSMDNLGPIHWELVLCLLLAWVIVCLSLIKGIKSSGKVVYFTALFPYAVLIILFVMGMTLEGSGKGIRFYIMEIDYSKLGEAKVWKDAAVQIFFSLSASWGGLIALASYNRFHNDTLRDSLIVSLGNCLTSFFAGFVVFSFLGFLAHQTGQEVKDVVDSGVGLAFIVYPAAVTFMPASPFWAIIFFIMLITLGLDSEFALMETVTTSCMDQFPVLRKYKSLLIVGFGCVFFLLGLTMCTSGGSFMLTLIDTYAGGWNVLVIAFMECICISYVYGVFRFKEDIRVMLGPTGCGCFPWNICYPWWMICWAFFTPVGVLFVLIFSWVDYAPIEDSPQWADSLGWCMTLTVIVCIVVTPIVQLCMAEGSFVERMRYLTTPTEFWGPALVKHRAEVRHLPDFVVDPHGENPEGVDANEMKMEYQRDNLGYS